MRQGRFIEPEGLPEFPQLRAMSAEQEEAALAAAQRLGPMMIGPSSICWMVRADGPDLDLSLTLADLDTGEFVRATLAEVFGLLKATTADNDTNRGNA